MPQELYNEGRVTGFSSYEIYVKQSQALDPNSEPATERQWLASSLAMGSSMLMQMPTNTKVDDDEVWMYEVDLPSNSHLCAANTIIGQFFKGDAHLGSTGVWADRVTDYGDLISNTSSSSPNSSGSSVPTQIITDWSTDDKQQLVNYLKVIDGLFYQPGTWSTSAVTPPAKDFLPSMDAPSKLRLEVKGPIDTPFWILFTAFTIRAVVYGESGLDGSTNTTDPEDGDFLGPGQYPWAARITFSVPSSYVTYFDMMSYVRKIPSKDTSSLVVDDTSIIDMKTTRPEDYYDDNGDYADNNKNYWKLFTDSYSDPREPVAVDEFSTTGDGTAVLTIFQRSEKYPPALWGSFVTSTGSNHLQPIDCVAPGSVKMFYDDDGTNMKDYEDTFPGSTSMSKDEDGKLYTLDKDGNIVEAAAVSTVNLDHSLISSSDSNAKGVVTTTGKLSELSLSVGPGGGTANQYTISNDSSSNEGLSGSMSSLSVTSGNVFWSALLEALANNKSLDILGTNLKQQKIGLPRNYILFGNGLRLYISSTEPQPDSSDPNGSSIPVGSIGIGWEEE